MTITSHTKTQLSDASRIAITDAMNDLPLNSGSPQWLLNGQKYTQADISKDLSDDYKNGAIDGRALAQRIAASVPSHVVDGWSYFGRAIHCLIRGDTRNSVHLGYYAELRAALAILAAEGIGVFNTQHFVIDGSFVGHRLETEKASPIKSGTHSIIWPLYRWWSQQNMSKDLVTSVIQPGGQAMSAWFNSPNKRSIYLLSSAETWLGDWGLDLKRMKQDFGARNASSYGPSAIHDWQILPGLTAVETVMSLWGLFGPPSSSRFNEVDRLLLRRVLRTVFNGQTRRRMGSKNWNRDFGVFVNEFLEEQTNSQIIERERLRWKQFLTDPTGGNGFPLESASGQSAINASQFPVESLSRAALLLRIATGSCGLHLNDIGIGWDSLEFWLNDIGVRRGFWERGAYPVDPTDLWTDIEEALDVIVEVQQSGDMQGQSPFGTNPPSFKSSLTRLEECERVGLWGFGI